jgi:hypothetical protein
MFDCVVAAYGVFVYASLMDAWVIYNHLKE